MKRLSLVFFLLLFCYSCKLWAEAPLDDNVITTQVVREIKNEPEVAGLPINVSTNSGVVSLSGSVDTVKNVSLLVEIAESVANVKDVATANLTVTGDQTRLADAIIEGKIEGTYLRKKIFGEDIHIKTLPVTVTSNNGLVFLDGVVDNHDQMINAILVAQKISGVQRVISRLNIRSITVNM